MHGKQAKKWIDSYLIYIKWYIFLHYWMYPFFVHSGVSFACIVHKYVLNSYFFITIYRIFGLGNVHIAHSITNVLCQKQQLSINNNSLQYVCGNCEKEGCSKWFISNLFSKNMIHEWDRPNFQILHANKNVHWMPIGVKQSISYFNIVLFSFICLYKLLFVEAIWEKRAKRTRTKIYQIGDVDYWGCTMVVQWWMADITIFTKEVSEKKPSGLKTKTIWRTYCLL
jgi:hypothetical protein